jgi:hypothetical protein
MANARETQGWKEPERPPNDSAKSCTSSVHLERRLLRASRSKERSSKLGTTDDPAGKETKLTQAT